MRSAAIHPPSDPLAALRQATASRHALLDAGLAIGQPGATLAHYQAHLLMLQAWMVPIESWLGAYADGPQGPQAPPPLLRSELIAADLAHFSSSRMRGPMPTQAPWPAHASAAYRWGVCYVMEGAQLGGAVLYQRLAPSLAPHPLHYLRGAPEGPGPRWRSFLIALRAALRTENDVEMACSGARAAFDRILALQPAVTTTNAHLVDIV